MDDLTHHPRTSPPPPPPWVEAVALVVLGLVLLWGLGRALAISRNLPLTPPLPSAALEEL